MPQAELTDKIQRLVSTVHMANDQSPDPLDIGYTQSANDMVNLANDPHQKRNPELGNKEFKQVEGLFQRQSDAAIQHGSSDLSSTGQLVDSLNSMAREVHTFVKRNILSLGMKDAEQVLRSKNPAVFSVASDLEVPEAGKDPVRYRSPYPKTN